MAIGPWNMHTTAIITHRHTVDDIFDDFLAETSVFLHLTEDMTVSMATR